MSPEQSSVLQQRKNRKLLLTVAAIFVLPLALAQLVLALGWYTPGASNKGNLINPPIELSSEENNVLPDTWRIATVVPASCNDACLNALYVLSQSYHALGRMQNRVTPVGLQAADRLVLPEVPSDSQLQFITVPGAVNALADIPANSLLIVDPLGNVVMWYEGSSDRQTTIMQARDLLSDLKKMLKMSRVG